MLDVSSQTQAILLRYSLTTPSPRSNRQRLTVKLDALVDGPIVVAAAQVALAAKTEVVETVQAKVAKMAEPDLPPRARTALLDGTTGAIIADRTNIVANNATHSRT